VKHRDIYLELLQSTNLDKVKLLLQREGVYEQFDITSVDLITEKPLPYLLFSVNADEIFAAKWVGLFMDIKSVIPDYVSQWYYLPAIAFCENYPESIQSLINKDVSLHHEYLHLSDLLDLIERNPDYPQRVFNFSLQSVEKLEDLNESIDLEIFKLFYLEPQAFTYDFSQGENTIYINFLGRIVEYKCDTLNEYIQMKMYDYLGDLESAYVEKFPAHSEQVKAEIQKGIQQYGQPAFGEHPFQAWQDLKSNYVNRVLKSAIKA